MTSIKSASQIETVAGSLVTESVLTAVAVSAGTPIAALLPILSKSLAAERQKTRVESALTKIDEILQRHENLLATITDQQYKFINETILALLFTTSQEKMVMLGNVIENGLHAGHIPDQEAVFLSRIVRDISADEANFLLMNFSYDRIWLNETPQGETEINTLTVSPTSADGHIVLGLVTLGLVVVAEPTWDDSGLLRYSPMVAKLIALLKQP